MPGIVRKLLIFAAIDGLILQPAPPRNHPPTTQQAIKIDYKGNISPLLKDRREEDTTPNSLEAHGIVGLLKVASASFLISISSREQVAVIRGKPVYVVTDVALIPLSSQADANNAITQAREHVKRLNKAPESEDGADSESESDDASQSTAETIDDAIETAPPGEVVKDPETGQVHRRKTSVAEDVIGRKGMYGRFAQKWFSKKGWSTEGRRREGMSSEEDLANRQSPKDEMPPSPKVQAKSGEEAQNVNAEAPQEAGKEGDEQIKPDELQKAISNSDGPDEATVALLPKILRTTKLYFGSRNFYFSYDYDLSHGLADQAPSSTSLPLHKQFEPLYFWTHNLIAPFIEAGQNSFVLPLIQGFVGQRTFTVDIPTDAAQSKIVDSESKPEKVIDKQPEKTPPTTPPPEQEETATEDPQPGRKDFVLTLISRRSIKRAGLRYLRRGVDEEGNVANSVETEQILCNPSWDTTTEPAYSFTQYRGSIPLFFSQSPYSLKPIPQFYGSHDTNMSAFRLHFTKLAARYGGIHCASLVDKHGSEAKIGEAFQQYADELNSSGGIPGANQSLGFEWFDFHHVCRGMKFENVSLLLESIRPFLERSRYTIISSSSPSQKQSGVLRTNCMDCLDRTNVVQSAAARHALEDQLAQQQITIDLQHDPSTSWFNTLWADNGDAISKQYAGTAALKGDYTRTRRRRPLGALTDFGLTLTRYFHNIVNDFFAQAAIDFLLGRAGEDVFAEFEAEMQAHDYAVDLRKVRQAAIQRAAEIVIRPGEELVGGWVAGVPVKGGALLGAFEEAVLLLTEQAVYLVRLDWGTEKVRGFERVPLSWLKGVKRGSYFTSALGKRAGVKERNVGGVLLYGVHGAEGEEVKVNTRTVDAGEDAARDEIAEEKTGTEEAPGPDGEERFIAFKALPPRSSFATLDADEAEDLSETQMTQLITDEIVRVANAERRKGRGSTAAAAAAGKAAGESEEAAGAEPEPPLTVQEGEIVSLAEARKRTGYLEQVSWAMKKLVWG